MVYKSSIEVSILVADSDGEAVTRPDAAARLVYPSYSPLWEVAHVLVLDNAHLKLTSIQIAQGNGNTMVLSPAEVLRAVLLAGGLAFIFTHSHPSRQVAPSEEDLVFTRRMAKASEMVGIKFLDHLIHSDTAFYSFKAEGLL